MINHIKLAEEFGAHVAYPETIAAMVIFTKEELQAYTDAILERAAVKCDGKLCLIRDEWGMEREQAAYVACAEAIRQENV